jgi:hypothetical protein
MRAGAVRDQIRNVRITVLSAIAWRIFAELMRRHAGKREVRVLEFHPGISMYGAIRLIFDANGRDTGGGMSLTLYLGGPSGTWEVRRKGEHAASKGDDFFFRMLSDDPAELIDDMDLALGLVAPKKLGASTRPALVATLISRFLESRMLSRESFRTTQGWYDFSNGCGVQKWTRHFGVDFATENVALESGKRQAISVFEDVWPFVALFECRSDPSPLSDEGGHPVVLLDLRAARMLLVKNGKVIEDIDVKAAYVMAGRRFDGLLQTIGTHFS